MERILLVDYMGYSDSQGIPTGHTNKVLQDNIDMLKDKFIVDVMAPLANINMLHGYNKAYDIGYQDGLVDRRFHGIKLIFKKLKVIKNALDKTSKVWFVTTDHWLYFAVVFYSAKTKIYITNYDDYFHAKNVKERIWNWFYAKASNKVQTFFTTDRSSNRAKDIYVPDYWYKKDYSKYDSDRRIPSVYMCGSMNSAKEIENAIEVFGINKQPLVVKGLFFSDERLSKCQSLAGENTSIQSIRMDKEEYYENLGKYQFSLLPYRKEAYSHRSSGIILESVFLGTIVIAPNFMLRYLGIDGIGYDDIYELNEFCINNVTMERCEEIKKNNAVLLSKYSYENVAKKYMEALYE